MRETKHYDEEFKQNAVELFLKSGKRMSHFAHELGVAPSTLRDWKNKYLEEIKGTPERYANKATPAEMAQEIYKLRQENNNLKKQREILKKALGILSDQAPPRMPE